MNITAFFFIFVLSLEPGKRERERGGEREGERETKKEKKPTLGYYSVIAPRCVSLVMFESIRTVDGCVLCRYAL